MKQDGLFELEKKTSENFRIHNWIRLDMFIHREIFSSAVEKETQKLCYDNFLDPGRFYRLATVGLACER